MIASGIRSYAALVTGHSTGLWATFTSWLWLHLGINGTGPWYGFWSGFGSDMTEFVVFGTPLVLWYRHMECQEPTCHWPGARVTVEENGHQYRRCKKHHEARHADAGSNP